MNLDVPFPLNTNMQRSKVRAITEHQNLPATRKGKIKQHFQPKFPYKGLKHRKIKETTDQQNTRSTKQTKLRFQANVPHLGPAECAERLS